MQVKKFHYALIYNKNWGTHRLTIRYHQGVRFREGYLRTYKVLSCTVKDDRVWHYEFSKIEEKNIFGIFIKISEALFNKIISVYGLKNYAAEIEKFKWQNSKYI